MDSISSQYPGFVRDVFKRDVVNTDSERDVQDSKRDVVNTDSERDVQDSKRDVVNTDSERDVQDSKRDVVNTDSERDVQDSQLLLDQIHEFVSPPPMYLGDIKVNTRVLAEEQKYCEKPGWRKGISVPVDRRGKGEHKTIISQMEQGGEKDRKLRNW